VATNRSRLRHIIARNDEPFEAAVQRLVEGVLMPFESIRTGIGYVQEHELSTDCPSYADGLLNGRLRVG